MVKIQTRKQNIGLEKVGSFVEVDAVMADIDVRVLSKLHRTEQFRHCLFECVEIPDVF